MEGQILKAFDIQELFMTYEENHLELLLEDSYRIQTIETSSHFIASEIFNCSNDSNI